MLRRKIDEFLTHWKARPNHKPLIIKGCRQCGKTSSVLAFARSNYANVVYLDFHEHSEYRAIFGGALDVDTITLNMSIAVPNARLIPHQTCIVLDEIQDCPAARSSLKFFKIDGRYDVICTGSLLGVNGYREPEDVKASIPVGYEHIVTMYPMDFEEWLWANGITDEHVEYLTRCLNEEVRVTEAVHQRLRQLLLRYVVVGGMPDAVVTYLETNNLADVQTVQRNIVEGYKADMLKYAPQPDKSKIRQCFDSIPMQLAKENKKFQYSLISKGARAADFAGSLQWIEDAGIIRRCYNTSITELPLNGNRLADHFKVYMCDIGLLVSMLEDGTAWSIMQGDLHSYKGAIFENLAADFFIKMGRELYFFQKPGGVELDFLIRYRGQCCPVECKATTGNAKSLKSVLKHPEHYHVASAIKLGDYNVGRSEQMLSLPFYLGFLLREP